MKIPIIVGLLATISAATLVAQQDGRPAQSFKFKSTAELINVSATVTDASGRFVANLRKEDFLLWEDGRPQTVTHFSDERVPVSLGIVLDTSGSMEGEKFRSAEAAINRFLQDLLSPEDEVFLYTFADEPQLLQEWTQDRRAVARTLSMIRPRGGTAMYDAVAEAIPLAQSGRNRRKAIVVISDGNDTNSHTDERALRSLIRETEVLIYAIGIDGDGPSTWSSGGSTQPRWPIPFPLPGGGGRRGPQWPGQPPTRPRAPGGGGGTGGADNRVNVGALRDLTDDSGGRTEVVRDTADLSPATTSIADELSQQYSLGYTPAAAKDGRWHTIRVEAQNADLRVRARRGYIATP